MNPTMRIGPDVINEDSDCYVIAEIGHNHQGRIEQCRSLFLAAKRAGANAVKLQKRNNRELYTKAFFDKPYNSENSYGATYGEHREALEFGRAEYKELANYAKDIGITFFSTAFDFSSADFLEDLDMPAYKIASGDLTNIPLVRHIASFGKPLVISSGGATVEDVQRAYDLIMSINPQVCVMQCTSGYPCRYEDLNLKVIANYKELFPGAIIGYSGHDNGIAMPIAAYALGARMIEKHFTLDRSLKGTDHAFSLERPGLEKMVRDLKRARVAMGDGVKKPIESEHAPLVKMQKCLVASRAIPAGHTLTKADIAIKSPGDGLLPYHYDLVLGATTTKALREEEQITYEALDVAPPVDAAPRTLRQRCERVRLVAFDFDGVFTDNRVYVDQNGIEMVACTRADGLGLERLADVGIEAVVVSSEVNTVVAARCKKLGIRCVHGTRNKLQDVTRIATERGLGLDQVAFVGNDLNDVDCMKGVGLPIAVQDAHQSAKQVAAMVTTAVGGSGCVREVCELIASHAAKATPAFVRHAA